jgi:hypothetical protein
MPNSLKGVIPSLHLKAVFLKGLRPSEIKFNNHPG